MILQFFSKLNLSKSCVKAVTVCLVEAVLVCLVTFIIPWSPLWAKNQGKTERCWSPQHFLDFAQLKKANWGNSNSAVVVDAANVANEWVVAPSFQAFNLFSPMSRLREACKYYFFFFFQRNLHSCFHLPFNVSSALIKPDSKKNFQTQQDGRIAVASSTSS